jgi:hypothetical protein
MSSQYVMREGELKGIGNNQKEKSFCCGAGRAETCGRRSKQGKELIRIDLSRQQKLELLLWQPLVIFVTL